MNNKEWAIHVLAQPETHTKEMVETARRLMLTHKIAFAAAQDAGNRAMKKGGRKIWSAGDYRKACQEFERLWPSPDAKPATADDALLARPELTPDSAMTEHVFLYDRETDDAIILPAYITDRRWHNTDAGTAPMTGEDFIIEARNRSEALDANATKRLAELAQEQAVREWCNMFFGATYTTLLRR